MRKISLLIITLSACGEPSTRAPTPAAVVSVASAPIGPIRSVPVLGVVSEFGSERILVGRLGRPATVVTGDAMLAFTEGGIMRRYKSKLARAELFPDPARGANEGHRSLWATRGADAVLVVGGKQVVEVASGSPPRPLAYTNAHAYVAAVALAAHDVVLLECRPDVEHCRLVSIPRGGGARKFLSHAWFGPIAEEAGWIYFWDLARRLCAISASGGKTRVLSTPLAPSFHAPMEIESGHVVFASLIGRERDTWREHLAAVPVNATEQRPIVLAALEGQYGQPGPGHIAQIAAHRGFVFFTTDRSLTIRRVGLTGGAVAIAADCPKYPATIAVDDFALTYSAGDQLYVLREGYLP